MLILRNAFTLLLWVCLLSGSALADERDEAIFGSDESTPKNDDLEEQFEASLEERNATTAIGGFGYFRLATSLNDETEFSNTLLSTPSLLDIYVDGRPNERTRLYVRGRMRHSLGASRDFLGEPTEDTSVELDQLWLKFDIDRTVFLTVGRQPIRWGAGRFWNPTDFLHSQVRNPLAVFDDRSGMSLIKAHLPIESLGWNLYAVMNLENLENLSEAAGALRAEILWEQTEVSLTAAARNKGPLQLGIDLSSGIWDFDVHVEAAFSHRLETTFFRGDAAANLLEPYSRSEEWIPQVVAGIEYALRYSDEDSVIFGVEYFFNDAGYESADYYPALFLEGALKPLYSGREYLAASIVLMAPGSWNDSTFIISGLTNLSDQSLLTRVDYRVRVLTHLGLSLYAAHHSGELGGELRPYVEGVLPAPTFDVGMGLQLTF